MTSSKVQTAFVGPGKIFENVNAKYIHINITVLRNIFFHSTCMLKSNAFKRIWNSLKVAEVLVNVFCCRALPETIRLEYI